MRITCDGCEKQFEAPDENAGGKIACPYCGDVNRVPELHTPESEGLPPDSGPEQHICVVRPAMFRAHPFRAVFIAMLFIVGIVGCYFAWSEQRWLAYISLVPSVLAVLWAIKWWIAAHWWIKLNISNKRVIRRAGIITRRSSEVLHDHVRNVEIRQSFLQRLLNVGYIGISSSGQDGIEIEVFDIPNPDKVKSLIDKYREM